MENLGRLFIAIIVIAFAIHLSNKECETKKEYIFINPIETQNS